MAKNSSEESSLAALKSGVPNDLRGKGPRKVTEHPLINLRKGCYVKKEKEGLVMSRMYPTFLF